MYFMPSLYYLDVYGIRLQMLKKFFKTVHSFSGTNIVNNFTKIIKVFKKPFLTLVTLHLQQKTQYKIGF
jgi:hypothetical protein